MRMVDCLERADIAWCGIDGVAVNHWAEEPMVTQDVDFVVAAEAVDRAVSILEEAGFQAERFEWSVNFKGRSKVSLQLKHRGVLPRISFQSGSGGRLWHSSAGGLARRYVAR